MNWFRSRGAKKKETEDNLYTRWEQDKDLQAVPVLGLFDEYLEMGEWVWESMWCVGTL